MIITIILIILAILAIYAYLYFTPKFDKVTDGSYVIWYTYRNQINKGIFKKERRYFYIKQFRL